MDTLYFFLLPPTWTIEYICIGYLHFLSLKNYCNKNPVQASWSASVGYWIKASKQFKSQWMLHGNETKGKDLHHEWLWSWPTSLLLEQERGEDVCPGHCTVSRNTLPGSVEGSFYPLSAHRDGNLEVTPPGCPEADDVTVPPCRQAAMPWGMEINVRRR